MLIDTYSVELCMHFLFVSLRLSCGVTVEAYRMHTTHTKVNDARFYIIALFHFLILFLISASLPGNAHPKVITCKQISQPSS